MAEIVKDKLTASYMRSSRVIYACYLPFDTKNEWVYKQIGDKSPRQLIVQEALKTIHEVINYQSLPEIYKLLRFPRSFRKAISISVSNPPKTIRCRKTTIYKAIRQFNMLHNLLKFSHTKIFKRQIEKCKIQEVPND